MIKIGNKIRGASTHISLDISPLECYRYMTLRFITKTRLYSFDPLKPHFYTVKLGFKGVDINFLIFHQKHRLWVLVRTASPSGSNEYHILCFEQKYENYHHLSSESFHILVVKFSTYLNRRVFVMDDGAGQ